MPNGTSGDHPYTDIVFYGHEVYSAAADALVREIAMLADDRTRRALADRLVHEFNVHRNPDVAELERVLTEMRDRLKREGRARGFESFRARMWNFRITADDTKRKLSG